MASQHSINLENETMNIHSLGWPDINRLGDPISERDKQARLNGRVKAITDIISIYGWSWDGKLDGWINGPVLIYPVGKDANLDAPDRFKASMKYFIKGGQQEIHATVADDLLVSEWITAQRILEIAIAGLKTTYIEVKMWWPSQRIEVFQIIGLLN